MKAAEPTPEKKTKKKKHEGTDGKTTEKKKVAADASAKKPRKHRGAGAEGSSAKRKPREKPSAAADGDKKTKPQQRATASKKASKGGSKGGSKGASKASSRGGAKGSSKGEGARSPKKRRPTVDRHTDRDRKVATVLRFDGSGAPVGDHTPAVQNWRLKPAESDEFLRGRADTKDLKKETNAVRHFYKHQTELLESFVALDQLHEDEFGRTPELEALEENKTAVKAAIYGSFAVNILLMAIKIVAAATSGSLTVIASALDSLLDLLSGAIIFATGRSNILSCVLVPSSCPLTPLFVHFLLLGFCTQLSS
jgi:Cation efflux family